MLSLPVLGLLASTAHAISVSTKFACTTHFGAVSKSLVPTQTISVSSIQTLTKIIKTIPTTTVTPPTVSTTLTSTKVDSTEVETQTTDTYTTSRTSTSTIVVPEVDTAFETTTTTITTTLASTTTIDAPAGFTPLQSVAGFVPKKRNAVLDKLEAQVARNVGTLNVPGAQDKQHVAVTTKASFPKNVVCRNILISYVTATSTKTAVTFSTVTAVADTTSLTETATSTSTSTKVLADATSFVTVSTSTSVTSTSTSWTTTTQTNTATIKLPSATFLAQCAPANLASSYNGLNIGYLSYNRAFKLHGVSILDTTGYDCCAKCAATANCAGFGQNSNGKCYYITTNGQCDGSQTFGDTFHYYLTSGLAYTIGNGQCGALAPAPGSS